MDEKDDPEKAAGTCFEGPLCAEMMMKIVAERGLGSLCEERLRSLLARRPAKPTRRTNEPERDRENTDGGTK